MLAVGGCAAMDRPRSSDTLLPADAGVVQTSLDQEPETGIESKPAPPGAAAAANPAVPDAGLTGPLPVEALIQHALSRNANVRAAWFNVAAVKERIPQVTALEDPVLSNSIFPIPSVAPQFSLMGYMPYDFLLAQQFPWFGTLRLRGQAAEQDVQIALYELAAAQLDVVANVKRAYFDLHFNEQAAALLRQNRALAEDFLAVARERYRTGSASQADVLRADTAISDIDRELQTVLGAMVEAQSELARLAHLPPETPFQTLAELPLGSVPKQVERLYQLAIVSRPDLKGRIAAIARDERAIDLARKRYRPNVTLGLIYQDMEKRNAMTPMTAGGMPNVGLFVGMNLPIYRGKLDAGVREAHARAAADSALYEAERDQSQRDVKDLFVQANVQQNLLKLLRKTNVPAARQILDATSNDYRAGNAGVDYLNVITAWRDLLQVELQVAQLETELGKTLASLERAVGIQINEQPPEPAALASPPPSAAPGPFQQPEKQPENQPDAAPDHEADIRKIEYRAPAAATTPRSQPQ